jgi:hypothetical protein
MQIVSPRVDDAPGSRFFITLLSLPHRYRDRFPVLGLFDFDRVRQNIEPVRYNYARDGITLAEALAVIEREAR